MTRESRIEARLGAAVQAWVTGVERRARSVLLACLVCGVGAAVYAAQHLGMHSDIHALVDPDVPFMRLREAFERSFPLVDDMLLLVVDADSPREASDAAGVLALRLERERDVFRAAFVPAGGPFFERNALLYLELSELEELADRVAAAQPFLAEVQRDPSLRGVFRLLGQAISALEGGGAGGIDPVPMIDRVALGLEALNQGRPPADAWRELLVGEWGQEEQARQVVLLSPKLDLDAFQPAARAVERVRQVVAESGLAERGVRARLTGDFVLTYEENEVLVGQAAVLGAASFVLVGLLLAIALRSAWLIAATLLTLVAGLAASLAYAALAVGYLNPISVAFPVLLIGLSADFGIHLCLRYRELRAAGFDHPRSLENTARGVGSSIVLCAVTTGIGFFAFVPTEFVGLAQLGWIAGPGMLISLFFSLTLLPALLCVAPAGVQARWSAPARPVAASRFGVRYPRAVRWLALGFGLGGLALLPRARFDPNQLHVRDPGTESVQAFSDLLESARTSPWTVSVLAGDLEEAQVVARRLEALPEVERTVSPRDLVPEDQPEKLELVADIAGFVAPTAAPRAPMPSLHAQLAALHDFEAQVRDLAKDARDAALAERARHLAGLAAALRGKIESAADPEGELATLEAALLDPIEWWLTRLRRAGRAEPVVLEDLPRAVRDQMIGADGRIRVEVFPAQDVGDPATLSAFVDAVTQVEPEAAGHALYLVEFGRSMVRSLQQALVTAAVLIGLLLYLLWRRLDDTVLVLGILGLASVLTTAAALLIGIPFNFADAIALPLLLGLGVDSSIHLVHRFRTEGGTGDGLLHTSTARAVTYSGLTTLASFGSLAFASHLGMASIGQLLTVGVVLMLLCNLVVLPALLDRRDAGA